MPVFRVTIIPAGAPEGTTIAGDFIADNVPAASQLAGVMMQHPLVVPLLVEGFVVTVEPSQTDPRFAANYDGPAVHISTGGQC